MRARGIYATILAVAVFLGGIILSAVVIRTAIATKVDMVAINEALKIVEEYGDNLQQGDYGGITLPIAILDADGGLLYQNYEGPEPTVHDAIRSRSTIVDIRAEDAIVGKLIVRHDDDQSLQLMKQRFAMILVTAFTILALLCALYALFLQHTIFKPFRKLQGFAANVARGHLDMPLSMGKDNPFGAFTESFDIMREELAAARQSEYEANRSKKELVASLSHDIKTPVASIKAVSELMLLRATDEKTTKQLNTIHSKAEQIDRLITDIFHATLEELSELKVTVAEELSSVLYGIIRNANDHDRIVCDPIPECMIVTDVHRLQQVLDNVVSNAHKYAGTQVTISSSLTNTHLELHIHDEGDGIHEEELPLVFNKFYRGSNAEGQSGSGLGLYISQYLMQRMQGDIDCHNREDGFMVTLRIKLA